MASTSPATAQPMNGVLFPSNIAMAVQCEWKHGTPTSMSLLLTDKLDCRELSLHCSHIGYIMDYWKIAELLMMSTPFNTHAPLPLELPADVCTGIRFTLPTLP